MPIGSWSAYQRVIQGILATNPSSVLDIGIGFGMNGCGIRNWLDLGVDFKTKLVGIEAFPHYRNPAWALYDDVILGDVTKIIDTVGDFDLIVITDVIEHFDKEDGIKLLEKLKTKCRKGVIVSTPSVWIEQGDAYGNVYETHRSLWTVKDFKDLGYGIVWDGRKDEYGHMMLIADYIK
jgi:2-polyprenyl-3-methyl-5-hydroxy-6-metoxy-1,4-benzoquinol methylase